MISLSLLYTTLVVIWLWCIAALYFMLLPATKIAVIAAALFAFNCPFIYFLVADKQLALWLIFVVCALVFASWQNVKPSHDREWAASVAKLPYAQYEGENLHVFNIRNFDYRSETDFSARYYNKTYDLNGLETVDYILSYWDGNLAIAHVILSFGFANGDYLAVSVETRLQKDEPQGSLAGFFKQFELIYVLADEADVLRLRTNYRREQVYLYPTTTKKPAVRKLFDVVIGSVNQLYQQPEFYNTITDNCFSNLANKFNKVNERKVGFDYRRYAIGYSDQLLYEQNKMATDLSFEAAKTFFHINQYVQDEATAEDYSLKIRPFL